MNKRKKSASKSKPKSGRGSNPKSRKGAANLQRGRTNYKREVYPSDWENFVIRLKAVGSIRQASSDCHISYHTARAILDDPRTAGVIQRVEERILEKKIDLAAERFVLREGDVDAAMYDILVNGEHHPVRGDCDRVKSGGLIYEKMGLIQRRNINQNFAGASATAIAAGQNTYDVFKSGWKIKKESEMAERAEAEWKPALPPPTV